MVAARGGGDAHAHAKPWAWHLSAPFMIIQNDGTDPVVGTFAGLAQGATIVQGGMRFRISYDGGTGNDVVLTRIA